MVLCPLQALSPHRLSQRSLHKYNDGLQAQRQKPDPSCLPLCFCQLLFWILVLFSTLELMLKMFSCFLDHLHLQNTFQLPFALASHLKVSSVHSPSQTKFLRPKSKVETWCVSPTELGEVALLHSAENK